MNFIGAEIVYDIHTRRKPKKEKHICKGIKDYSELISQAEAGKIHIKSISEDHLLNYDEEKLRELKSDYLSAKGYYIMVSDIENKIDREILNDHVFLESMEWMKLFRHSERERITDPTMLYALNTDDLKLFMQTANPMYRKAGIADSDAYEKMIEAADKLIEYGISIIPDKQHRDLLIWSLQWSKHKKHILDLFLQLPC